MANAFALDKSTQAEIEVIDMAQSQPTPNRTFLFEYPGSTEESLAAGEILARNEADARRQLRVKFRTPSLPADLRLFDKVERDRQRSHQVRYLLRILSAHHDWVVDGAGARADLAGAALRNTSLHKRTLSFADLSEADLENADLRESNLYACNLRSAVLRGADLRGADLRNADLSDADLRGANLLGARLDGIEVWRANLQGCTIGAKQLHTALGCRSR